MELEKGVISLTREQINGIIEETPFDRYPDVQVEIKTTASEDDILNVMRGIVDSHVMIQTLRPIPLADNNLERNYEAE